MLFPTSLVGSYPQPDWLIDRARLAAASRRGSGPGSCGGCPSTWREAQDDATLLAIRAKEAAGLDIITDGEIRRESYSNRFATALDGVDIDNPGRAWTAAATRTRCRGWSGRSGGAIRCRSRPGFLRAHTDRTVKVTVPGPFTMSQQAQNDYYGDREAAGLRLRRGRQRGGTRPVRRRRRHRPARRALPAGPAGRGPRRVRARGAEPGARGRRRDTAVHICFGYAAIIHERPAGYPFLPELADCPADQVPSRPPSLAWTARCSPRWTARRSSSA